VPDEIVGTAAALVLPSYVLVLALAVTVIKRFVMLNEPEVEAVSAGEEDALNV
jgi:hypothetical protein